MQTAGGPYDHDPERRQVLRLDRARIRRAVRYASEGEIRRYILGIVGVTPWEDGEVDTLRELTLDLATNDQEGDGDD
jgi:hypothetical protein